MKTTSANYSCDQIADASVGLDSAIEKIALPVLQGSLLGEGTSK